MATPVFSILSPFWQPFNYSITHWQFHFYIKKIPIEVEEMGKADKDHFLFFASHLQVLNMLMYSKMVKVFVDQITRELFHYYREYLKKLFILIRLFIELSSTVNHSLLLCMAKKQNTVYRYLSRCRIPGDGGEMVQLCAVKFEGFSDIYIDGYSVMLHQIISALL